MAIPFAQTAAAAVAAQNQAAEEKADKRSANALAELDKAAWRLQEMSKATTTAVRLDGLALTKLVQHSREVHPAHAYGVLLGLHLDGELEVNNGFALPHLPSPSEREDAAEPDSPIKKLVTRYSAAMVRNLREVNADANPVGIYVGCLMGQFLNTSLIEALFAVSDMIEKSGTPGQGRAILLVHDLAQSAMGNTEIRAFRLAPDFIAAYQEGKFTVQTLLEHELTFSKVLIEIPVSQHNTAFLDAFVSTLSTVPAASPCAVPLSTQDKLQAPVAPLDTHAPNANLTLALTPTLSTAVAKTLDSLDEFASESGNIGFQLRQLARERVRAQTYLERKKVENDARAAQGQAPLPVEDVNKLFKLHQQPSRLETLMLLNQMDEAAKSLASISAVGSLQLNAVKPGAI